jgi:hypothetical protein
MKNMLTIASFFSASSLQDEKLSGTKEEEKKSIS